MSADEDWDFHLAVLPHSGNPLFEQIIAAMYEMFHRFWEHPLGVRDFGHASFPYHRTLFNAIAARDADRRARRSIETDCHRRGRSQARCRKPEKAEQEEPRMSDNPYFHDQDHDGASRNAACP